MDPAIARVSTPASSLFEDGLGQRRVASSVDGGALEALTLREELTASPSFELALRERAIKLADFRSEHYAQVRGVEKVGKGAGRLVLVSEHVPGVRLAEMLAVAERRLLPVETNAALCLIRQLVHAIAVLHDKVPHVCHGAIGPERLLVTPNARLIVVEHVLGSALEGLKLSNKQYWEQLRLPLPRTFGMPIFDKRSDVTQVGATALALIIGRPLADDEFPGQVAEMTGSALTLSAGGAIEPLPLPLRVWLQRALQIDSRNPFSSALEAWAELDRVLHYSDPIAELEALKQFLTRYHSTAPAASSPMLSRAPVSSSASGPPPMSTRPQPTSKPSVVPGAASAAPQPASTPVSFPPPPAPAAPPSVGTSATAGFWDKPVRTEDPEAPPPAAAEPARQSVPAVRQSRLRLAVAAILLIALTSGVTLAARRFLMAPVAADGMGTLVVQTNPNGAVVDIDGDRRGVTPLSLDLTPGRHTLKLANEGNVRSMPIVITAGGQVSHFIELPRASTVLGELRVRSDPAGAQVTVDGHAYGKSPLTVEGLAPGVHTVVLENEHGVFSQEVKIEAGTTASLVMPMTTPRNAPVSGWIAVKAPSELQVFEGGQLLGTSQSDRIMVSIGRHRLEIVNEALGFKDTRVVNVSPGRVTTVKPAWPKGTISVNAVPWAEVWIDGESIGETPRGNVSVPIGTHEVVFRHPELGEKAVQAVVALGVPAKVSVDLSLR